MNGQDKITISGVVFHVEKNCCPQLNAYLDTLCKQSLKELKEELVAELLLEELREEGKEVITKVEVEHLIQKTKHLQMPD
ncbi:hypothetical protein GCM10011340_14620 [Roseivirga thermotolerans]|uniref:Uncharacterized protein n=2 Tax=Roseivirgaceae TaxID=2762306 RepID=A0ABQ3I7K4_9BACT|nr:hypothetical protein GCM10011340_14620 [Roseivirga thermotolerans]